jgi:hypothetical protein
MKNNHTWWPLLLACALLILGVKLMTIYYSASRVPFLDQWDGIGANMIQPWLAGDLTLKKLAAAHNEHPLIYTRVQSFGLLLFNQKQWDPLVETLANALLHIAIFILIAGIFKIILIYKHALIATLGLAAVWLAPHAYENTLWGFQNAFLLSSGPFLRLALSASL